MGLGVTSLGQLQLNIEFKASLGYVPPTDPHTPKQDEKEEEEEKEKEEMEKKKMDFVLTGN